MIRVVLADDHPVVLEGLDRVLGAEPDIDVVACCPTGNDALAAVARYDPDILLLDLALTDMSGLDVIRQLPPARTCRVILLTGQSDPDACHEAVRLGAAGVALKSGESTLLLDCVRRVFSGERCVEHLAAAGPATSTRQEGVLLLTPREREIVEMAGDGLRNRDIAERLFITEGTVKLHLHNIYQKLGVNGRPQLIRLATTLGRVSNVQAHREPGRRDEPLPFRTSTETPDT